MSLIIRLLAVFNTKLKAGVVGRTETFTKLKNAIQPTDKTFWFHCASLGEYEQGLPVFEALKAKFPYYKVVLSFFSPSGYEIKKTTKIADVVVYLPLDTPKNASQFLDLIHPNYCVFVKYEIWPNLLHELAKRKLNAILISAVFRKKQAFFKWYGFFMTSALFAFKHIFTQDDTSKTLLNSINYNAVSVSGDTRFDRVSAQLHTDNTVDFIKLFKAESTLLVLGSTWPADDALFIDYINRYASKKLKFVIAPHEIKPKYTATLKSKISANTICYSEKENLNIANYNVFILDTIGYLSKVYSYADIAYVGGAAGNTGLHNILEPAVFGIPILIGKNFDKFPEAKLLIKHGGVISVATPTAFETELQHLVSDTTYRTHIGAINSNFVNAQKGGVHSIINYICTDLL